MKFAPFKPCTLPKHVRVEILHREFPVKNLYFPCKGLQCNRKKKFLWPVNSRSPSYTNAQNLLEN